MSKGISISFHFPRNFALSLFYLNTKSHYKIDPNVNFSKSRRIPNGQNFLRISPNGIRPRAFDLSMMSRSPVTRRLDYSGRFRGSRDRSLQTFPPERVHSDLVRRRGGLISVSGKLTAPPERKMTKLLLNVNIERSLGPVQVVMAPENRVRDLIKAATEIYMKEKRRPLLKETDPSVFELHYSQFSLESLKADERLINLGSRNFFLCSKPSNSPNSCCSEEAEKATNSSFPFTKFMDFLL